MLLIDVCLTGLSGIELVRDLRRLFGQRLTLVVTSADDRYEERAILFGADLFLPKPTTMRDVSTLWQLVARRKIQSSDGLVAGQSAGSRPDPNSTSSRDISIDGQKTQKKPGIDDRMKTMSSTTSSDDSMDSFNSREWLDTELDAIYPEGRVYSLEPYKYVQELGTGVCSPLLNPVVMLPCSLAYHSRVTRCFPSGICDGKLDASHRGNYGWLRCGKMH